jgi:hypothetical protein
MLFKPNGDGSVRPGDVDRRLPLLGRKLHVHVDWSGEIDRR